MLNSIDTYSIVFSQIDSIFPRLNLVCDGGTTLAAVLLASLACLSSSMILSCSVTWFLEPRVPSVLSETRRKWRMRSAMVWARMSSDHTVLANICNTSPVIRDMSSDAPSLVV